jgi:ketosteroid isomerase-like protein
VRVVTPVERAVELLTSVGQVDVDALAEHWTDDLVFELPYADPPVVRHGKQAVCAWLRRALTTFSLRLDVTDVYECPAQHVVVAEYTSTGRATTTGKPYKNSYICVFTFRGDKVCRQREFYNPLPAAEALRETTIAASTP